uniref:Uncharacterized protein n=1 Tax=Ursus americanus TaxID=9643 RepID=A0A452SR50_URSAM
RAWGRAGRVGWSRGQTGWPSCPPTGRIDCQRHCGIFQYETISCSNCTDSHVVCFGYNCDLISPSFTCLEPPHLANLTLENASECLTQH